MKRNIELDKFSNQNVKARREQFRTGTGNMVMRMTVYQHAPGQFHIIRNKQAIPVVYSNMTGFHVAPNWQSPQVALMGV